VERFPALRMILRFGRAGAGVLALVVTVSVIARSWGGLGWPSLIEAPFVFVFVYFLAKSYVEIVQIITEMVH
jgi:hypothetical protein